MYHNQRQLLISALDVDTQAPGFSWRPYMPAVQVTKIQALIFRYSHLPFSPLSWILIHHISFSPFLPPPRTHIQALACSTYLTIAAAMGFASRYASIIIVFFTTVVCYILSATSRDLQQQEAQGLDFRMLIIFILFNLLVITAQVKRWYCTAQCHLLPTELS